MEYEFPYLSMPVLHIPDDIPTTIFRPNELSVDSRDTLEILHESLAHPIGSARLKQMVEANSSILIIIDDMSRPTPVSKILPIVIEELSAANIPAHNIKILIALGTHRKMTRGEIEAKVGTAIASSYEILNHEWNNPAALHDYGTLENGGKIILNKHLLEADCIIAVGSITPHPAAGFSGGGKIISPGVATEEAAGDFHWKSVQVPQKEVLGVRDNPMRAIIDEIASKSGLSFIVNVVLNAKKEIIFCVSGDPVEAHRRGCELSLKVWGVKIPKDQAANIYIIDTHPMDQDLWQAVKAVCSLDTFMPDNSIFLLVSGAVEGIAPTHPEVLEHGYLTLPQASSLLAAGTVDKIVAHNLVQVGRVLARSTGFLVTPTISPADAPKLGFEKGFYFTDIQTAFEEALLMLKTAPNILIMTSAGEICPL